MFRLIDSHCHLDAPELNGTGAQLLPGARSRGIATFLIPGVRVSGWQPMLAFSAREAGIFAAPGLHPVYAEQWSADAARQLRELSTHPKTVAIGEIGLDGAAGPDLAHQEKVLRAQLEIALAAGLPVLLHCRKATGRLLEILRELQIGERIGGIWHGFSAGLPVAEDLVRLGFMIGIGPILLRPSARKLPEAVRRLPATALVLETDLPDMAEKPEALLAVAAKIAELRGWTLQETARITTENAGRLFGIEI